MTELEKIRDFKNPFYDAPVYYIDRIDSTMRLSEKREADIPGTVYLAGSQTSGRGRLPGRIWEGEKDKNLLFTLVLSGDDTDGNALSVRIGLGIALYLEKYHGLKASVKWPNDIYINGKKIAGIIIENRKNRYNIGIGLNINQLAFSENIDSSATSLAIEKNSSFNLYGELELVLSELKRTLENEDFWQDMVNKRLYSIGREIVLNAGDSDREKSISGVIEGVGLSGQLLLRSREDLLELYGGEIGSIL